MKPSSAPVAASDRVVHTLLVAVQRRLVVPLPSVGLADGSEGGARASLVTEISKGQPRILQYHQRSVVGAPQIEDIADRAAHVGPDVVGKPADALAVGWIAQCAREHQARRSGLLGGRSQLLRVHSAGDQVHAAGEPDRPQLLRLWAGVKGPCRAGRDPDCINAPDVVHLLSDSQAARAF